MLRIHFSVADCANVHLEGERQPLIGEALLALQMLRRGDQRTRFGLWRAGLAGRVPAAVRPLWDLVPARGLIPDFLTPSVPATDVPGVLDAIRSTPAGRIAAELDRLAAASVPPGWARRLAAGERAAVDAVAGAVVDFNQIAIVPHAPRMKAAIDAELAHRTSVLANAGLTELLTGLHPALRWRPPVLTLPSPADADIELGGRGLALVPTVFCGPMPRLYLGDVGREQAALIYPIPFDPISANPLAEATPSRQRESAAALGRLLGSTRATVLHCICAAAGLTTAELAQRADISLASASEHATVLRQAGLITSMREGNRIRHYATGTAATLLAASRL